MKQYFAIAAIAMAGMSAGIAMADETKPAEPKTTATAAATTATAKTEQPASKEVTLPSGTKYEDVAVGTGPEAKAGAMVRVHYTGTLTNGKKFDSSRDRNQPFPFQLGEGQVIKGWDEGVAGMKVGGKRKLTIPPSAGYGPGGMPPVIPPNSTLLFDVELLGVQ